jgi:hypothetical protein
VNTKGDEFMDVGAVAAELGVSTARIRRMLIDGDIQGEKFPPDNPQRGVWLIKRSEVERVKAEREAQAKQEKRGRGRPPKSTEQ